MGTRTISEKEGCQPPLLFWQILVLAALAGGCVLRNPALGLTGFLACCFLRSLSLRSFLVLVLAFLSGICLMFTALPREPEMPPWASRPRTPVLLEGTVLSSSGLPGGRMRVLLESVQRLEHADGLPYGEVLPGLVSLTLDKNLLDTVGIPVAGQKLAGMMRLYPSGGNSNFGVQGIDRYWADRGVWRSARIKRDRYGPEFLVLRESKGLFYEVNRLRWRWRDNLYKALSLPEAEKTQDKESLSGFWRVPENTDMSQGKAMLVALLFGDRSGLSPRTIDLFTRAGLVHSLALSGQHLALASMAGVAFVLMLSLLSRRLFLVVPRRMLMVAAGIPFAIGYLFLGGAPLSIIRAALMMIAAAVFLCRRRAFTSLDVLFAAVLLLFLGRPLSLFDLSAQLSVLAVAGILLAVPVTVRIYRFFSTPENSPFWIRSGYFAIRWLSVTLIISFTAQAAVLPILATVFGAVGPCFWLNAVWLPPMTFITLPCAALGLLFLLLGFPFLADILLSVAAWPADRMLEILEFLDGYGCIPFVQCLRPSSITSLGYVVALVVVLYALGSLQGKRLRFGVRWLIAGVFLMFCGQAPALVDKLSASVENRVELSVLDVGQGQAVLITYPGGRMLVDGGGSSSPFFDYGRSIVAPALTDRCLPRLDAVIVSHNDIDHIRGLHWILAHFDVGTLYWSKVSAQRANKGDALKLHEIAEARGIPERIVKAGDVIPLASDVFVEVLAPEDMETAPSEKQLSDNDASLVLRLVREDHGLAVLCGDMSSSRLRRLAVSGRELHAEVIVLSHHGAASGFQKRFYDAVHPEIAVASAGSFNHYGFPSTKVREEMLRRAVPLLSTSTSGGIVISWGKDGRHRRTAGKPWSKVTQAQGAS